MTKIIIRDANGSSNLPLAVLTMKTEASILDHWLSELESKPGKFNLEMITNFDFDWRCSEGLPEVLNAMLMNYQMIHGSVEPKHVFMSIAGVCQGFAFSIESGFVEGNRI